MLKVMQNVKRKRYQTLTRLLAVKIVLEDLDVIEKNVAMLTMYAIVIVMSVSNAKHQP